MKGLLVFTCLLVSNLCFGQLRAVIVDMDSKEVIPFVNIWVQNENIGTTSNEKGAFELDIDSTKIIVFSAIGYQTTKISSDSIQKLLELRPIVTQLNEVIINSKRQSKEFVIGEFKKSEINHYFACGTKPWITARYFKFEEHYDETTFLNKIKLLTHSDIRDSKFNIRLYGVSENGEPEGYIFDENIIGIAKKGKKITDIDLSNLNIEFPKKGFFIAIEWLIIESNKHEYSYTMQDSNKKLNGVSYEPAVGAVPAVTNENSWLFMKGKWSKIFKNSSTASKGYKNKYSLLAIELTLTN